MYTHNDYSMAIELFATENRNFLKLTQTEQQNLMYLYVRDKYVDLFGNEELKKVLVNFYRHKDDVSIGGVEVMNIVHHKIIEEINLDLNDEISNLEDEHDIAFPFKWNPEDDIESFLRIGDEDNNDYRQVNY